MTQLRFLAKVSFVVIASLLAGLYLFPGPWPASTSSDKGTADKGSADEGKRFIRYVSSPWEQLWLDNIDQWTREKRICEEMLSDQQRPFLTNFLKGICTSSPSDDICYINDALHAYTINPVTLKRKKVDLYDEHYDINPLHPKNPQVFSYFEFETHDGTILREYIEPLVVHLRHPLAVCVHADNYLVDRSYMVPSQDPTLSTKRAFYFDAGSSHWNKGAGGPSLAYFIPVWERQGLQWHSLECWEGMTAPDVFHKSVPAKYNNITLYHQMMVSSSPSDDPERHFIPDIIRNKVTKDDYVIFKLDIDSPGIENVQVEYLLSDKGKSALELIDEFVYEHHVVNYLMLNSWGVRKGPSIADSYQMFLRLRQKGVRAHSYV